jgi:hypothetical protein
MATTNAKQMNSLITKKLLTLSCAVGAAGSLQAASFVLTGTQMTVGVDESGGLIDASFTAGIIPAWRPAVDYLRPGTPFQFYSIGVNNQWLSAGYSPGNNFGASTVNTSAGPILSARTTGTFGDLSFTQLLWFGVNDTTIRYEITFMNNGLAPLENVVYAVGLDPDQEADLGITYDTLNFIPDGNRVIAAGPTVGDWIRISSYDVLPHVPSVDVDWNEDPYFLLTGPNDGHGDNTINMAFRIGDMLPGQMVSFGYAISIGTVIPEPRAYALLGGLGLLGFAAYRRFRK